MDVKTLTNYLGYHYGFVTVMMKRSDGTLTDVTSVTEGWMLADGCRVVDEEHKGAESVLILGSDD